jgi:hypothetical protein
VDLAELRVLELDREPDVYDSHPASGQRLARAAAMAAPGVQHADDHELVWTAFEDHETLERQMTAQVRANVAENHGVRIPAGEEPLVNVTP